MLIAFIAILTTPKSPNIICLEPKNINKKFLPKLDDILLKYKINPTSTKTIRKL